MFPHKQDFRTEYSELWGYKLNHFLPGTWARLWTSKLICYYITGIRKDNIFFFCGTTAEFLHCSAPKHPHITLRESKIPLSKVSKGFSTTAERKKHFCDHRWLKGLSNFTNLLIIPATDTEKSYRYHREINTVGEKNQIFSLPKVQGFIWLPSADISRGTISKRKMYFHTKDNEAHEKKWP